MKYYSQDKQDEFLNKKIFKGRQHGFFVDIGAFDGVSGSNTMFFEKLGWRGICVEPVPSIFKKLQENRNSYLFPVACGSQNGEKKFTIFPDNSMLSGFTDTLNKKHIDEITTSDVRAKTHEVTIPVMTLSEIIKCAKYDIDSIDYLSIDVEGGEFDILNSVDFSEYFIDVISVEDVYLEGKFESLLSKKGYVLVWCNTYEKIFVNKMSINYKKLFRLRELYCRFFIAIVKFKWRFL